MAHPLLKENRARPAEGRLRFDQILEERRPIATVFDARSFVELVLIVAYSTERDEFCFSAGKSTAGCQKRRKDQDAACQSLESRRRSHWPRPLRSIIAEKTLSSCNLPSSFSSCLIGVLLLQALLLISFRLFRCRLRLVVVPKKKKREFFRLLLLLLLLFILPSRRQRRQRVARGDLFGLLVLSSASQQRVASCYLSCTVRNNSSSSYCTGSCCCCCCFLLLSAAPPLLTILFFYAAALPWKLLLLLFILLSETSTAVVPAAAVSQ